MGKISRSCVVDWSQRPYETSQNRHSSNLESYPRQTRLPMEFSRKLGHLSSVILCHWHDFWRRAVISSFERVTDLCQVQVAVSLAVPYHSLVHAYEGEFPVHQICRNVSAHKLKALVECSLLFAQLGRSLPVCLHNEGTQVQCQGQLACTMVDSNSRMESCELKPESGSP